MTGVCSATTGAVEEQDDLRARRRRRRSDRRRRIAVRRPEVERERHRPLAKRCTVERADPEVVVVSRDRDLHGVGGALRQVAWRLERQNALDDVVYGLKRTDFVFGASGVNQDRLPDRRPRQEIAIEPELDGGVDRDVGLLGCRKRRDDVRRRTVSGIEVRITLIAAERAERRSDDECAARQLSA
jgi:hypothetical protein